MPFFIRVGRIIRLCGSSDVPLRRCDCIHTYFDSLRAPHYVVRVSESHALKQLLRVVVADSMSGDNQRQAQHIESVSEHGAQSLLTESQSPDRPHEIDTYFDCLWVHLPLPEPAHPANSPVSRKKIGQYCMPMRFSHSRST